MVSIIILAYNKSNLLRKCLSSLHKHISSEEAEIIVVDNASTDDTVGMVKKEFRSVQLIENSRNAGFAGGCNLGAKHARGEYLLFFNSDAEFMQDSLSEMVRTFSEYNNVGVVGGLLMGHNGELQRSSGKFYTLLNVIRLLFAGEKEELKYFDTKKIALADWVSGGCMLVKKEVFDKVKGFNESYFMYIEDMDLCYRVKKAGFLTYINPFVKVKHLGQGSGNRQFAIVHIYEGLQIFYKQQRSTVEYYIVKVLLALKACLALFFGIITLNRSLAKTYSAALKTI